MIKSALNDNFPLEAAKWPVLVLDINGCIEHCNEAARKQLSRDGNDVKNLEDIWTGDNGCSSAEFLKRISTAPISTFPLHLKTKVVGKRKTFSAHICHLQESERKLMLIQFFARKMSSTGMTTFITREVSGDLSAKLQEVGKSPGAEKQSDPEESAILTSAVTPEAPPLRKSRI